MRIKYFLAKIKDDSSPEEIRQKPRAKTSLPSRFPKSVITSIDTDLLPTPESKFTPIEQVKFAAKKTEEEECSTSSHPSADIKKNFLDECYESLEKMENFWVAYNKTEIDVMELKTEKSTLEKENKQLRGLIRAVLESAALTKNIPESRVATRAPSKRRSAYSAPLHRIAF